MTALAAARGTVQMDGGVIPATLTVKLATATTVYQGGIVCVDTSTGYGTPGAVSTTLIVMGIAEETVTNSGANGAKSVNVRPGVFKMVNYASDPIAQANVGAECYIFDDQTVAATDGTAARSVAGKIVQVDSDGVWIAMGPYPVPGSTYLTTTGAQTVSNKRITLKTGTDVTADITLTMASGCLFEVIAGANTTITLPTSANDGDNMIFYRPGTEAYSVAIGSLMTIPSGQPGYANVVYLHSAWRLLAHEIRAAGFPTAVQGAAIAFVGADVTVAVADGEEFDIPSTASNSTVTLATTGAKKGSKLRFRADGTNNGHTITYRVGATAITAAATASKRHLCDCSFDGTTWVASMVVGP